MNLSWKQKTISLLSAILLCGLPASTLYSADSTYKAKIIAPDAVTAAFHKAYPKAKILDVSIETVDSVEYFEIESQDSTTRRDILYTSAGMAFEIEESMTFVELPVKVKETLRAKFPKGNFQKAERIIRGDVIEYDVWLESQNNDYEVLLSSAGVIKSEKTLKEEDEESGENDAESEDND